MKNNTKSRPVLAQYDHAEADDILTELATEFRLREGPGVPVDVIKLTVGGPDLRAAMRSLQAL
jgi:hypothetical protein